MRKLVLAFCLVFFAASLFGQQCNPPAGKLFLLVPGISPNSGTPSCPKGIELSSVRIQVSGLTMPSRNGTMTFTKVIDSSSPLLFRFTADGKHLAEIILFVPASDGKSDTYRVKDALISSIRHTASPASESVTVDFKGFEGRQYRPAGAEHGDSSFVEVTGPGPYSFQGSAPSAGVQLSMKAGDQDVKISGITLTVNVRNGKVEMRMAATTPGREMQADAARAGGTSYDKATLSLTRGSTPFASYVLDDVKMRAVGSQTSIEFAKIEFRFGTAPPGSTSPDRFNWNLKDNKAV